VENGIARGPDWGGRPLGAIRQDGPTFETEQSDGFVANCVYGHPNYPDGFLRTSVLDLSRYVRAYLNRGAFGGYRVLRPETIATMLDATGVQGTSPADRGRHQGLNWMAQAKVNGELAWGHGGSDPGVNTDMRILLDTGIGAIVFTNTNGIDPWDLTHEMLEIATGSGA
jgi:CubicO group peptidase (beta-lactamase class C family)